MDGNVDPLCHTLIYHLKLLLGQFQDSRRIGCPAYEITQTFQNSFILEAMWAYQNLQLKNISQQDQDHSVSRPFSSKMFNFALYRCIENKNLIIWSVWMSFSVPPCIQWENVLTIFCSSSYSIIQDSSVLLVPQKMFHFDHSNVEW